MRGGRSTYGGALRDTLKCGTQVNACFNVHHLIAVHLPPADTALSFVLDTPLWRTLTIHAYSFLHQGTYLQGTYCLTNGSSLMD